MLIETADRIGSFQAKVKYLTKRKPNTRFKKKMPERSLDFPTLLCGASPLHSRKLRSHCCWYIVVFVSARSHCSAEFGTYPCLCISIVSNNPKIGTDEIWRRYLIKYIVLLQQECEDQLPINSALHYNVFQQAPYCKRCLYNKRRMRFNPMWRMQSEKL